MKFKLDLPKIDAHAPEHQIAQMRSFLIRHIATLEWALNTLGAEESGGEEGLEQGILQDTGWMPLGLSEDVATSDSGAGRAGVGCFYRVLNDVHVYVAFNGAFTYGGSPIVVNADLIPEAYRPSTNNFSVCAASGNAVAQTCVNTAGEVIVSCLQKMGSGTVTASHEVTWIDVSVDYWLDQPAISEETDEGGT